ncbi:MAG: tyrosine-type recombinase/integrase [Thermoguttaceae bacterium]
MYFGKVADDPQGKAALDKWLDRKEDLLAGRTPRVAGNDLTIRDLCNRFLTNRQNKIDSGELSVVTFHDYYDACARIVKAFGVNRLVSDLDAGDFEKFRASMAKGWSPVTLANEVQRVRVVFRYAEQNQLVPTPIHYGSEFRRPSKKILRKARQAKGLRMFEAAELRAILDKARMPIKAMILLGINCGFGNSDIANLSLKVLNLKDGWVDFPRPKTAIQRRCPLWPETVAEIRKAIKERPAPKDDTAKKLLFLTRFGRQWAQAVINEPDPKTGKKKIWSDDPVGKEFSKLLRELKLNRPGLGFYALRHTFETIAGDSRDQVAVDAIMGHADDSMASLYRERISDDRLKAVVDHVHKWLFENKETK